MGFLDSKKGARIRRANVYGRKDADEMWECTDDDGIVGRGLSKKNNENSQNNAIRNIIKKARAKGHKRVRIGNRLFDLDDEGD